MSDHSRRWSDSGLSKYIKYLPIIITWSTIAVGYGMLKTEVETLKKDNDWLKQTIFDILKNGGTHGR